MKNTLKIIWIIAILAMIELAIMTCGDEG